MSENQQGETRGKRGRPAGKKNLPIPENWSLLIKACGGVTATAKTLDVSYVTFRRWLDGKPIAEQHVGHLLTVCAEKGVKSPIG